MESADELKAHVEACSNSKMAARLKMLHQLVSAGILADRGGKIKHDETTKVGDELKSHYKWCFCNGGDTISSKMAKKMLKK